MVCHRKDSKAGNLSGDEDRETHSLILMELMDVESEYLDGWRQRWPEGRMYTHSNTALLTQTSAGESRIDRIYIRADWFMNTEDWAIVPLQHTDHSAVMFRYCPTNTAYGKGRYRMGHTIIENKEFQDKCEDLLLKFVADHSGADPEALRGPPENPGAVLAAWLELKKEIAGLARRSEAKLRGALRSRKHTLRLQAQKDTREEAAREALLEELKEMEEDDRRDYCHNAFVRDYVEEETPSTSFYQRVKWMKGKGHAIPKLKDAAGRVTSEAGEMVAVVEAFYGDLYQPKPSDREARRELFSAMTEKVDRNDARGLDHPADAVSVVKAILKGKLGRAPGADGIPHDWYKAQMTHRGCDQDDYEDSAVVKALVVFFRAVQAEESLPGWFLEGVLTVLYKKDDPTEIKNYRPLSIMGSDYRMYTWTLTQRLVPLLESVLGDHQSAFLPSRFIGDNVKLVQGVIDKFGDDEDGAGVLFLDQEKAYDRVSRTYLWAAMRRIGLPDSFIRRVKALYHDATIVPYVNGQRGRAIQVSSGVRQGDALSCILFNLVMEPLAMSFQRSDLLAGIELSNGDVVKCCLYADDTVTFPRDISELIEVGRIIGVFQQASGQRVNWVKTVLMLLGGFDITGLTGDFRAVKLLRRGEAYTHLGIPVGFEIGDALAKFWDEMIADLGDRVANWSRLRLSQRSRLTIAKTLLVSVPVFAIQHLDLSRRNQGRIERLQQVLIWGGTRVRLSTEHSRLRKDHGGFAAYNLDAARTAWSIAWVGRMERRPNLPWVQMAITLLRGSRSTGTQLAKAQAPWKQVYNVTRQSVVKTPSLKHIWEPWWAEMGYPGNFRPQATLNFRYPSTIDEVLDTNFWYFPRLLEEGPHRNRGAALWTSPTWGRIANGDYGDINVIGDLLDVSRIAPRENLGLRAPERTQGRRAVETLINGLPTQWRDLLDRARGDGVQRVWVPPGARDPPMPPFPHCGIATDFREEVQPGTVPVWKWIPVADMYYKYAYKVMAHAKQNPRALNSRVARIRSVMARKLGRVVRTTELWKSVYDKDVAPLRVPKMNDLLYRLLLGVVECGPALHWLDEAAQRCPLDRQLQTVEHVWVECSAAQEVWGAFERIYGKASRGRSSADRPRDASEMIGMLALGPGFRDRPDDTKRWHILYSEAVWQIWKIYLGDQFRSETDAMAQKSPGGIYHSAVLHRIMMDRARVLSPKYRQGTLRVGASAFGKTWGQGPERIVGNAGPACLR